MEPEELMPIAIVGMSCRLPGDVSSPGDFWKLLTKGRNGWSKIPKDRFNQEAYSHPNPEKKGTINSQGGYFLSQDVEMFDPGFFDMTRKEAETMDPTQRILLECSYEALENAGIPKESIAGEKVGVFIGGPDNEHRMGNLRDLDDSPMFDPTGAQGAFLAGRISYFFNLRGPTFTVDAACSSSMHALHMAVQSIRSGESDQAIVGASHLITQPDVWVSMAKLRLFADSGKTYAFDHRAKSGYARGEGVVCLILKPLSKAMEDRDHVSAVISHTGISHNGRTVGIVAPSSEEQERLLLHVLAQANIDARDIGFFEAHGTGTKVGDPIEAKGIYRALGRSLNMDEPLSIGSVKSNVGHLENASGLVSVMKAALMLEKGFIVPNADFEKENPAIPLSKWNLKISRRQQPFPQNKNYICVNNFGYSGSNGHAVLKAVPEENEIEFLDAAKFEGHIKMKRLFVLSANDEAAVRKSMEHLGIFLEQHAELYQSTMPRNLAYTLCQRRSHLSWRVAIVTDMCSKLAMALNSPEAIPKRVPAKSPKLGFVFTGQGAQWYAMGRELLYSHSVFASAIEQADKHLMSIGADFSLVEELTRVEKETRVGMAHISQPICSAVQIGLVDLLASWGIKPCAVTGHSSGEIGAAYATGALTLETAMSAAYYRGQAIIALKKNFQEVKGAMMAVGASAKDLQPLLKRLRHPLQAVAACENSPSSTTVSGDEVAIDELSAILASEQIFNRRLFVDVAYHSPHMKLIAEIYHSMIADVELRETNGAVEFFSSLRGRKVAPDELGPQYWVENLTNPVRFTTAIQLLCRESQPDVLIEIGPHAALKGPIMQILKSQESLVANAPVYFPTLVRGRHATETCLELAGQLFMRGYEGINFFSINHNRSEVEKPDVIPFLYTYPWSRQRCWYESRITRQHRLKPFARHDLIGTLTDWSSDLEPTWRNFIRFEDLPWLREYRIEDRSIFPVSAFISMAVEAANQWSALKGLEATRFEFYDIIVPAQLFLMDDEQVEILLSFRPCSGSNLARSEFHITSFEPKRGWLEHCHGSVETKHLPSDNTNTIRSVERSNQKPRSNTLSIPATSFYFNLDSKGIAYPHTFWNLTSMDVDNHGANAKGVLQDTKLIMPLAYESSYLVHPAILESLIQISQTDLGINHVGIPQLPAAIGQLRIELIDDWERIPGSRFTVRSTKDVKSGSFLAELFAPIESEAPRVSMLGLELAPLKSIMPAPTKPRELCYKVRWEHAQKRQVNGVSHAHIKAHGERVTVVTGRSQDDTLVASLRDIIRMHSKVIPEISSLLNIKDFSGFFVVLSELDRAVLATATKKEFEQVQRMLTRAGGILWVTCGASKVPTNPSTNMALGLLRTARSELGKVAVTLDLDPDSTLDVEGQAELIEDAFRRAVLADNSQLEVELAEQGGEIVVPRFVVDEDMNLRVHRELGESEPYFQDFHQPRRQLQLATPVDGSFDTLYFEDTPAADLLDNDQVEIEVTSTRLSQGDVTAINNTDMSTEMIERSCSGTVVRVGSGVIDISVGDSVCALAEGRLGTHARAASNCVVEIPESMSFEDAALIPSAFCTAFYALSHVARINRSERVLIQINGDEGLAAIQVAQYLGAEVLVAVDSSEKRDFIVKSFGIKSGYVFDITSIHLEHELQDAFDGAGVGVVFTTSSALSSSTNSEKAWAHVAPFGRIIHIQGTLHDRESRRARPKLAENVSFMSVNLLSLAVTRPRFMRDILREVMEHFSQGVFKPLKKVLVLQMMNIGKGLQMIQQGSLHPIVVSTQKGDQVKALHHASKCFLNPNGTHIIIGGTGGLGRSMARWMVNHGARYIVLVSRSGEKGTELRRLMNETQDRATIIARACDIANEEEVVRLVGECIEALPAICGIVHAAMVLHDRLMEDMTHDSYLSTIRSKVNGTWNIHNALECVNARLDYFVLLSSAAGIIGSRGQAAYAAANTFLDGFAACQAARGLPTVSLNLTAVTGAGYIAGNAQRQEEILKNFGGQCVSEAEVLSLLAVATSGKCNSQCLTGLKLVPSSTGALPYYAEDPRFIHLKAAAMAETRAAGAATAEVVSYRSVFRATTSDDEARGVAIQGILQKLSEVLSVARNDVDAQRSMASYGLDSLTAIEVRNWITRELGATLEILELLTSSNVSDLAALIVSRTRA
ncbi:ketoacyl-synt-domain-containing protein [Xylariaceae sp. FL0662B]|nr:ketoacyl-synt-domain-containing protein [Xylariaceae sp. FL0662B]